MTKGQTENYNREVGFLLQLLDIVVQKSLELVCKKKLQVCRCRLENAISRAQLVILVVLRRPKCLHKWGQKTHCEISDGNWTIGHLYYILAKNLFIFCACPETLWESKFKGDELIYLVEESLRQPSIQAVAWLLLAAFSQIYSENWKQMEQKYLKSMWLS
jgi:hypothetical protein